MKLYLLLITIIIQSGCYAQNSSLSSQANKFLNSLSADQLKKALYDFEDDERYNWHFVPMNNRKGIMLSELDEQQKELGFGLLKFYLSDTGLKKTQEIIQLELILKELENRPKEDKHRDPGNYTIIFFGKPSDTIPWGWRFEGHHVSFNFSTIGNKIVAGTPGFMGSNPAIVLSGPQKGKQILKTETELGFELVRSFTSQQSAKAIISQDVPGEIVTSNARKAIIENQQGIFYSEMNNDQQQGCSILKNKKGSKQRRCG
ncbi:MAG TPA: DUF3500 domain-containing protein [Parafilimonas sp.]|nr:DUF3500 domain-containing protein [Parafilimonas sp.]